MTIDRREDSSPTIRHLLGTDDEPPRRRRVFESRIAGFFAGELVTEYRQVGWADEAAEPGPQQATDDPEAPA